MFKQCFFTQIRGISMGSICGPSLVNLYKFILEKHWLTINKPLGYGRFVDDVAIIAENLNLEEFSKLRIKYNRRLFIKFFRLTYRN